MTLDEAVSLLRVVYPALTPVQEWLLRRSWEGDTYTAMAQARHYRVEYLRRVGSELWTMLSDQVGEPVTKPRFREVVGRYTASKIQQQELASLAPADPAGATPPSPPFVSGPLPLDSPLYVRRPPMEDVALARVLQSGSLIRIKAPMKMGKSSLILRLLAEVQAHQGRTVSLNFQQADGAIFSHLDRFLRWLCANISRQLQIDASLDHYWDEELGSKVSCTYFLEECILESLSGPLVLALDEVNRVFEYPELATEFLPLLRFWHSQSAQSPLWRRLSLVLAYSTEVYVPLNLNQSPFNVGLPLELPPLSAAQGRSLLAEYGLAWPESLKMDPFFNLVGGFPYLVHLGLYHLQRGDTTLAHLLQDAPTEAGIYRQHLRQQLAYLTAAPDLLLAYRHVITATEAFKLEAVTAYKLDSLGLITLQGNRAMPSCDLYRLYFTEQLAGMDA